MNQPGCFDFITAEQLQAAATNVLPTLKTRPSHTLTAGNTCRVDFSSQEVHVDPWDWYSGSCLYHQKSHKYMGEYNIHGCLGYYFFTTICHLHCLCRVMMSCTHYKLNNELTQSLKGISTTLQYPESNYCKTSSCGGAGHAQYA